MRIWFANMYDDLHSKITLLINNIDLSFSQRTAKKSCEINIISEMKEKWKCPQLN